MTIKQKNKQTMGNSVTQTLDNNNSVWNGSTLFSDSVDEHKDNMADIANWATKQQQQLELKGLVRDKNLLRLVMIDTEMLRIIAALKAFGASTNNNQLITSVDKSRSELLRMSDNVFNTFAGTLKGIADDHAADILPLGITAQMLTDFALSCTSFDSIIKKPKALRGMLKSFTANLEEAVKKMVGFLKNTMDNQVRSLYQGSDFASEYFNSRKVYNYNDHRTELKGTVTSQSGHHIKNAIIELVNYPTPGESIFRHTNSNGNYSFKQLDLTTATLRVRAVGYTMAEFTVTMEQLKTNDFDIVMIPEPAVVEVPA